MVKWKHRPASIRADDVGGDEGLVKITKDIESSTLALSNMGHCARRTLPPTSLIAARIFTHPGSLLLSGYGVLTAVQQNKGRQ
eukprot:49671-Eustigmatos_ZCMA.PRE.1